MNRFIELAAENELYVVLRIGPYICGEYYYGGIPLWMRHQIDYDNGKEIECYRCADPVWKREMSRSVRTVVNKVKPLLASKGGPIIWMQVENEYDKDDEYLEWATSMARNTTTEIPWSLCGHNITQCNQLNRKHNKELSVHENKVICTVNGFWVEEGEHGSQPGPEFFKKLWSGNTAQPAVWTEDQGWFDIWNMAHRVRSTSDQLYGMARFFAYGGAYHNFYMLTGGNNYGLRAGRDATTAYAPDTVIDNFLLRHEPRFSSFQKFFQVVKEHEMELLYHSVPVSPIPLNLSSVAQTMRVEGTAELHQYGNLAFLSNFGELSNQSGYFDCGGNSYFLPNHTVVIVNLASQEVLFNTSASSSEKNAVESTLEPTKIRITDWRYFQEKVAYGAVHNNGPQESPDQLDITENLSDYTWYTFYTSTKGNISIEGKGWGGLQYSYVDGLRSDQITEPCWNRYSMKRRLRVTEGVRQFQEKSKSEADKKSVTTTATTQSVSLRRIDILSVAMGLTTVVSPQASKGVASVTISGEGNISNVYTNFSTAWKLKGEEMEIFTEAGTNRVDWQTVSSPKLSPDDGLIWLQGTFDVPEALHPFLGGAQPNQTAIAVNLGGLYKGMAYVNGWSIGRYWLARGSCPTNSVTSCAPPLHGRHCFLHYEGCGEPTQSLYHIPFALLKPQHNRITLFEENNASPHHHHQSRNLDHVFLEVLHNHPHW